MRVNPSSPAKCVSILEGGYHLDAIAESSVLHCKALMEGYPADHTVPTEPDAFLGIDDAQEVENEATEPVKESDTSLPNGIIESVKVEGSSDNSGDAKLVQSPPESTWTEVETPQKK